MDPSEYAALSLPDQFIEDEMQQREAEWITHTLRAKKTVLELGQGSGIIAAALRDAGKVVTVVEGAKEFIGNTPGVSYIHSMFEDFEAPYQFDCVIASFVLEHVKNPLELLKRARKWSERLIVVVGNAESWHRRVAVAMGIQPSLETLSERDRAVGHYMVYDYSLLQRHLGLSGWAVSNTEGFMLKPVSNRLMMGWPREVIQGLTKVKVPYRMAANIGCFCYGV